MIRSATARDHDAVWAIFEPVLPPLVYQGVGRPPKGNRECLHALLYLLAAGIGWEFLPKSFPSYKTVQRRLTRCVNAPGPPLELSQAPGQFQPRVPVVRMGGDHTLKPPGRSAPVTGHPGSQTGHIRCQKAVCARLRSEGSRLSPDCLNFGFEPLDLATLPVRAGQVGRLFQIPKVVAHLAQFLIKIAIGEFGVWHGAGLKRFPPVAARGIGLNNARNGRVIARRAKDPGR